LNFQKQENEGLIEHISNLEKTLEKIEQENTSMLKIKDDLIVGLDRVIKRVENENNSRNVRNDLVSIIQILIESTNNSKPQKNEYNANDNKNILDDSSDKTNEGRTPAKRRSYITHNNEKFKQYQAQVQEFAIKPDKLINQSKI
jgi:hypothetical protein